MAYNQRILLNYLRRLRKYRRLGSAISRGQVRSEVLAFVCIVVLSSWVKCLLRTMDSCFQISLKLIEVIISFIFLLIFYYKTITSI